MIGKKFGRLTVIAEHSKRQNNKRHWVCKCDCGKETVTYTGALRSGNTKSCGCLVSDTSRELIKKARLAYGEPHGHSIGGKTSPTYQSWRAMKQRCYCPKNKDYHSYGGRGIRVDTAWLDSFNMFLADMGPRPSKEYSLDRINPDGNYTSSNCQWILKSENSQKGNAQRNRKATSTRSEVLG
jgi:hypothetical protein